MDVHTMERWSLHERVAYTDLKLYVVNKIIYGAIWTEPRTRLVRSVAILYASRSIRYNPFKCACILQDTACVRMGDGLTVALGDNIPG